MAATKRGCCHCSLDTGAMCQDCYAMITQTALKFSAPLSFTTKRLVLSGKPTILVGYKGRLVIAQLKHSGPVTTGLGLPLDIETLEHLRGIAGDCRCQARLDLFRACDLLAVNENRAADGYAVALIRTLPQAIGRPPVLRQAGASPSFDEIWLLRLLDRAIADDFDSLAFLVHSRVSAYQRRAFVFLIKGLAQRIDAL
ncbi:hypothetical protein [Halovulum sp. GXIMD14793]